SLMFMNVRPRPMSIDWSSPPVAGREGVVWAAAGAARAATNTATVQIRVMKDVRIMFSSPLHEGSKNYTCCHDTPAAGQPRCRRVGLLCCLRVSVPRRKRHAAHTCGHDGDHRGVRARLALRPG